MDLDKFYEQIRNVVAATTNDMETFLMLKLRFPKVPTPEQILETQNTGMALRRILWKDYWSVDGAGLEAYTNDVIREIKHEDLHKRVPVQTCTTLDEAQGVHSNK